MTLASYTPVLLGSPGFEDVGTPPVGLCVTAWVNGSLPLTGTVLEMSPRDLKVRLDDDLAPGSMVELELSSSEFGFCTALRGVVHWRQMGSEPPVVGIFLNSALPHSVVGHYWADLRKELRYPCEWRCGVRGDRGGRPRDATLFNYSRSGLMVAVQGRLYEHEALWLIDSTPLELAPVVQGMVRWRSQISQDRCLLGCELPDEQGQRLAAYLRSVGYFD